MTWGPTICTSGGVGTRLAPRLDQKGKTPVYARLGIALLIAAFVAGACTSGEPEPTITTPATDAPVITEPGVPTAAEVFTEVSPAIAFVETEIATGSGILIERNLLLTAAHVVWPMREVRIAFPGGASTDSARVIGTDLMADLALIDVSGVSSQPDPVELGNGEDLPIGSTVYMIGYPAEPERNPDPTISEGILSRLREWHSEGWTFLQSDAAVVGGQSGGALVDATGRVIGVTNFQLATEYGISGSIADVNDRIDAMKSGTDRSQIGDRLPPTSGADKTHQVEVAHFWDQQVFIFEAPLFTEVEVSTNGDGDTAIQLMTIDGIEIAYADDGRSGGETAVGQVTLDGPHLAVVTSFMAGETSELVVGSEELIVWDDPDDGGVLSKPGKIYGNLDFPGDIDWFWLDLADGQSVTIEVDTVTVDPAIYIDATDNLSEFTYAFDDDSGGGPFGSNPRLIYTARETKTYLVIVTDEYITGPGAYVLSVD